MIRNLSLTFEDTAESAAKGIADQQNSLDSLEESVLDTSIALDYLLAEQGGVYSVAHTTCCTWIDTLGEIETQLIRSLKKPVGFRKVIPSVGVFR